jgi:hypothetical protein
MFLTVCNLILSSHPLGRSILDEARDQPIPGSFLKTLGTRLMVQTTKRFNQHSTVYKFESCLKLIDNEDKESIILGDINCDLL